ncbi:MAG: hypothetical protein ABIL15_02880 [candidate division WOR-3 bacterium]
MKRLLSLLTIFTFSVIILPMLNCEKGETGAPQNFEIAANSTGDKVVLSWDEPSEGVPDEYVIYFDEGGTGTFDTVATTTDLEYTHDPAGKTGKYKVAAKLGDNEYFSEVLSTIPIHTAVTTVYELEAAGNAGYGWDRTTFAGSTYSMASASNASKVDFYISNWFDDPQGGPWQTPYRIESPDEGPNDPGGVVPTGSWLQNRFTDPLTDPQAPLPVFSSTTYFNYTQITTDPTYIGVYTKADGYYALVKFSGANATNGTIQVETWFQSVKGLRLIAH